MKNPLNANLIGEVNMNNKIRELQRNEHIGKTITNNQGDVMKIIDYIDYQHIIVEFQDEFHYKVSATCQRFKCESQ